MSARSDTIPVDALIGLGANLGDRRRTIERAIAELASTPEVDVVRVSTFIETAPVGGPPQGPFLNGALLIETRLSAAALLARLQEIETALGRTRSVPDGPRSIDLDLLLFGDRIVCEEDLEVPHPRMLERRFVLEPAAEIAPGMRHPASGRTLADHRSELREAAREDRAVTRPMRASASSEDVARRCARFRAAGLSVGLVPTMGSLHDGHLALVRSARRECDRVVVSIFVNPTQFGPREDLASYPRPLEEDLELCRRAGVDIVLCGEAADLYPEGFQTWVRVEELSRPLCGASRPGHFRGVATVVAMLLDIVRPHRAYFGRKDYQQTLVIRRMIADLHLAVDVRTCPTVREPDGLAMSSRNAFLSSDERRRALAIRAALRSAAALVRGGQRFARTVRAALAEALPHGDGDRIDYAEVLDAATLEEFGADRLPGEPDRVLLAVAVFVGSTRLIDNEVV